MMLLVAYLFGGLWAIPPVFDVGSSYSLEPFKLACSLNWNDMSYTYLAIVMVFGFIMPLSIIVGTYVTMLVKMNNLRSACLHQSASKSKKIESAISKVKCYLKHSIYNFNKLQPSYVKLSVYQY